MMNIDISNKVVVITGASRGIGREIAKKFATEKANVVINYFKSEEMAKSLLDEITQYNSNCIIVKADVSKRIDVVNLYNETIKKFGKIDVLINNAGICQDDPILDLTSDKWNDVMNVNLNGVYNCTQIFVQNMVSNNFGKIINISSYKGMVGSEYQSNYCTSKSAIIGFTKSIAKELGKNNIAVNAVCPGFIVTDLNRNNMEKENTAIINSTMPIKNNLNNLVNFICYLSSENSNGISGQVFNIDSRIV